ncbi:MAG TPA: MFS transporter [Steroidobacteraceae bacterium]|nr:MFS transporter [Steroidobacteraceae bacterium]
MESTDSDDWVIGRRALAKASWHLLPLLFLGYGIAYMDRVNVGFAALRMNQDLRFSASIFGLGGGLFFLTYALCEIPSNMLLMRFGARRWIARIMVSWGVISSAMMFIRTPWQFYLMRLLLGAAEAGFFPGVVFYLTQWFPKEYRGRTISLFYFSGPLGAALMGALAGALLSLQGRSGMAGWQWLFLIQGLPAIVLGMIILALLCDRPAQAPWLSAPERSWLEAHLKAEHAWRSVPTPIPLSRITSDACLWRLCLCNVLIMGSNYSLSLSAPLLLRSAVHWDDVRIGALISATGVASALAMLVNGRLSDRSQERYVHTALPMLISAIAALAMGLWPTGPVIGIGYVICTTMAWTTQGVFWLIPSDALQGKSAAIGLAAIGSIGMLGAFTGPYGWGLARDLTGGYQVGLLGLTVAQASAFSLMMSLRRRYGGAPVISAA